jgi:hypothetical protein
MLRHFNRPFSFSLAEVQRTIHSPGGKGAENGPESRRFCHLFTRTETYMGSTPCLQFCYDSEA